MTSIRARVIAYAIAALLSQGAALSAAPIALCRGAMSAAEDLDACCANLKSGQTCPMHHKTHGAPRGRGPVWACVCNPSDAALASLIGVGGVLPVPVWTAQFAVRVIAIITLSSSTLERSQPPTSPPPRA